MRNNDLLRKSLQGAVMGASFWAALLAVWAAYASWGILTQVNTAGTWTPISSTEWNKIVTNLGTIDSKLSTVAVPTWGVVAFVGTTCPAGWSPADGTANGVKKTDGTSGTLDLRGQFIRWLNTFDWTAFRTDGNQDPDCSARTWGCSIGSWQGDLIKAHNHGLALDGNAGSAFLKFGNPNGTWGMSDMWNSWHFNTTSWGMNLNAANAETRPRNVALLYCVKN